MENESFSRPKGGIDCESARCRLNAGCLREPDGSWICICTQDLSTPNDDGSCPRDVVVHSYNTNNEEKKLGMLETETMKKSMMENSNSIERLSSNTTSWILGTPIIAILVVAIVIIIAVAVFIRRRRKRFFQNRRNSSMMIPGYDLASFGHQNSGQTEKEFILLREWIKMEEEISQGCYRGRYQRPGSSTSETVAVKILQSTADHRELIHKARMMAKISHPNVLSALGIVYNEGISGRTWLVFEYMSMGDLAHLLRTSTADFSHPTVPFGADNNPPILFQEFHLLSMAEQIASGMVYLSSQKYIHGDLACRNCLVNQLHRGNSEGNPGINLVKISDFEMSRDVYATDYFRIAGRQKLLPIRWMSPESILYGESSTKSDVWSYGIVLWEIFTMGSRPYNGHSNEEVIKLILDGVVLVPPKSASPLICQILRGCWKSRPDDRLSFQQIDDDLIADQRQRVRRSHKSVCSYISPDNTIFGNPKSRMVNLNNEDPVNYCERLRMPSVVESIPSQEYFQLANCYSHRLSCEENFLINI